MIKSFHSKIESGFDRLASVATRVLGSSITFIFALVTVFIWMTSHEFRSQSMHGIIRDSFLAVTFLSFFIVQKSVNRYSAALHLKVNELVASHEKASNKVVNVEDKTEEEIRELAKEYENIREGDDAV
jgi:low affinity Fe/Cu permease